jgi:hypothetical protein
MLYPRVCDPCLSARLAHAKPALVQGGYHFVDCATGWALHLARAIDQRFNFFLQFAGIHPWRLRRADCFLPLSRRQFEITIWEVLVNVSAWVETNGTAKLNGYDTVTQTLWPDPLLPDGSVSSQAAVGLA